MPTKMNKKYNQKLAEFGQNRNWKIESLIGEKKLRISRQDTVKEELVDWKIVQSNLIVISVNIYKS